MNNLNSKQKIILTGENNHTSSPDFKWFLDWDPRWQTSLLLLSCVHLIGTPWTAAYQASLIKLFIVYNGGYTKNGKGYLDNGNGNTYYMNKKVLFHQLPTGGYLQIEIDGNGVEISQEVLNDLTNVDIMNTEYK